MDQLHRRLKDEQIKVLFRAYCQGHLPRDAVQKTLGIGKTRFFALLREYRHDPETFSVCYTRATPSRVTPAVEQEIQREPLREREIVEDRRLPICGYNYSALRDRLAKRGIKVSVTTIIDPARRLDCYICFRLPDLLRFFRLLGHGHRLGPVVRRAPAAQFQQPLQSHQHHRILALLAHDAVALAEGLPVRAPRRQPLGAGEDLPEPDDHHAAGRAVARSVVDVRDLGRAARRLAGGGAVGAGAAEGGRPAEGRPGRLVDAAKERGVGTLVGERRGSGLRVPKGVSVRLFKDL